MYVEILMYLAKGLTISVINSVINFVLVPFSYHTAL